MPTRTVKPAAAKSPPSTAGQGNQASPGPLPVLGSSRITGVGAARTCETGVRVGSTAMGSTWVTRVDVGSGALAAVGSGVLVAAAGSVPVGVDVGMAVLVGMMVGVAVGGVPVAEGTGVAVGGVLVAEGTAVAVGGVPVGVSVAIGAAV